MLQAAQRQHGGQTHRRNRVVNERGDFFRFGATCQGHHPAMPQKGIGGTLPRDHGKNARNRSLSAKLAQRDGSKTAHPRRLIAQQFNDTGRSPGIPELAEGPGGLGAGFGIRIRQIRPDFLQGIELPQGPNPCPAGHAFRLQCEINNRLQRGRPLLCQRVGSPQPDALI